jgi:hypothetical protein
MFHKIIAQDEGMDYCYICGQVWEDTIDAYGPCSDVSAHCLDPYGNAGAHHWVGNGMTPNGYECYHCGLTEFVRDPKLSEFYYVATTWAPRKGE